MAMLMAVSFNSFFNSSSCVSAFLLLCGLGALFLHSASSCACSFVFLHWCGFQGVFSYGHAVLQFREALLWSWGPVVAYTSILSPFSSMQFISPCFFCLIVLSRSGSSSPLYRGLYFCSRAIYSPAVFGFVWSCFRGALAGVSGSYNNYNSSWIVPD